MTNVKRGNDQTGNVFVWACIAVAVFQVLARVEAVMSLARERKVEYDMASRFKRYLIGISILSK